MRYKIIGCEFRDSSGLGNFEVLVTEREQGLSHQNYAVDIILTGNVDKEKFHHRNFTHTFDSEELRDTFYDTIGIEQIKAMIMDWRKREDKPVTVHDLEPFKDEVWVKVLKEDKLMTANHVRDAVDDLAKKVNQIIGALNNLK
jgi:hypothetical protein